MVHPSTRPVSVDSAVDRMSRVADMLSEAVSLLREAIDETKREKEKGCEDDGDAAGEPDRNP